VRADKRNPLVAQSWRARHAPTNELALCGVLLLECLLFASAGHNFLSAGNLFEIVRLAVEVGLLAIALTPVIITAGIDLSVGSMLGLGAVLFGHLWRDAGLPWPLAAGVTLLLGLAGGALNAALIARFRMPPLIVTLGTFSLFRGLAEGLTRGIENYSGFPRAFLQLGQGYIADLIPVQVLVLGVVAISVGWTLHRTAIGRAWYAIGHASEGAHYAGLPVTSRLTLAYLLSGLLSSLAAIVYVAHLGQAKSDAGTGYELTAIAAVVLGGTSIFGGRGTLLGTMLGLFAMVVLQNGLRLNGLPTEFAGVLTGVLLLATILLDRAVRVPWATSPRVLSSLSEESPVRNSQVAVLSTVILTAALIVAGSNWWLVQSLRNPSSGNAPLSAGADTPPRDGPVIAMMPKAKGDPYFISARQGADSAAQAIGVTLLWDGPTELDPAKQNEVVEAWITRGVSAIAVSVENREAISTVLRKARQKGIKVITWDADAERDARDFFVNQATPEGIGQTLVDEAARVMKNEGEFAIVTASLSAANQNTWIAHIKQRLAAQYPKMRLVAIQPSDGDRDRAFSETQTILKVHPRVKLIMAIAAPAVPGAAEAVKQSGRTDVKVVGLSLPNMCRDYIKSGIVESIVLWNTLDLGALTVVAAAAAANGTLKAGTDELSAGGLGRFAVVGDEVRLGKPFVFNKSNIDRFNF
jgi:rhamnose transport system substrate-binding protein